MADHISLLKSTEILVLQDQSLDAIPTAPDSYLLANAVTTVAPSRFRPDALPDCFSKSHASSVKACLDRSGRHSEHICRFANAQAIDVAHLERCAHILR